MKEVRTITCHEVYNHGASLQEYALLEFLNLNGYHAKTINYKPDYLSGHFKLNAVNNPRYNKPVIKQLYLLANLPLRLRDLRQKKAFDRFAAKYIPTDNFLYRNNDELKHNLPEADAFICGSDQIWNSLFQNGKDPAFYLNFVPGNKLKISYAASFAIDRLADELKPFVKANVEHLNAVGVRESSGVRILNDLGVTKAVQVLDPVFLLDATYWETNFISKIEDKFVFVYDFDSNPLIKTIALSLKDTMGCAIYTINKNIKYADKNFYLNGPETFLNLLNNALFIVSNSFHALAFSLLFNKQFVIVNRTEKINTRMRDLLELMGISQLVSSYEEFKALNPVDFNAVNQKMKERICFSRNFLLNNLKLPL